MPFRLGSHPRARLSLAALVIFLVAQWPAAVHRVGPEDSLARAKRLAWLNNWAAAARVLDRLKQSGRLDADEGTRIFSRAVEIRGNIESLSLPAAAKELDTMLAAGAIRDDPELRLQVLAMKGDVEFQYDLGASERTWTEVSQLAAATGRDSWEGRAGGELGCVEFLNGEIYTALKMVVAAYFRAEVSHDVAEKMKTLTALGEGLAEFGRPADALRFFNRALDLSAENPDAYFPFTAYLGKARLLLATAAPGEGRQMLLTGLAEARRENMRVREARILIVLGDDAIRREDRPAAVKWLNAARDVARQAGLHRIEAEAESKLGSVLSDDGDFEKAAMYAKTGVAAAERAGDIYHLPRQLAALGEIEGNRGDLSAAKAAYEQAMHLVASLFSDLPNARHENTVVATMGGVYQGYFELALNKMHAPGMAFQILESARARGLVDRIRERQLEMRAEGPRDPVLVKEIAALNRRLVREQSFPDRRQLLDQLWETEVRSLRFTSAPVEPRSLSAARPVTLQDLQALMGEGELLIEYLLGPSRSFAFAVTHDQAVPYALKSRSEIETAITRQLQALQKKRDGKQEGTALYRLLLEPVTLLARNRRVTIVPDGKLNTAALGAAVDPEGRYFIETHVISFAPSATALQLLSCPRRLSRKRVEVLGVGGAVYSSMVTMPTQPGFRAGGVFNAFAPPRFSKLSRSGTEVADLETVGTWDTQTLTGNDASESVLKRLPLSDFDVLHFSLHSAIDRDFPDRSGLVLTSHSSDQEDDLLQAREIRSLKLNAELVTLSACDGAAGSSEGIAGTGQPCSGFSDGRRPQRRGEHLASR